LMSLFAISHNTERGDDRLQIDRHTKDSINRKNQPNQGHSTGA